ncbi:MAG: acetylglutamate kinase [Meiothermus sp.]|uniref:acetylglutamate kinase n=1 Tax=Meiothermus sp. TaxID=1955249 RepID=UPI0025CCF430|nr:acetylglutamate kinase [Meiothermus sp.]MCS7058673.1 acetylglutamate kinase [Meiothermus sp.]MCS7195265.1 acetylglutamate kinase [Meiothermus sp.]MCX7741523.1 acetylglutamate kinase [Meiothermus sp.]MDW8090000.1 acetylglutamate kinase [Meiothermus sp.]MDW8480651.1 acetylglutamate kinase [Meiothermus sp.]
MAQALLVKIGGSLREAGELLDELAGYPGPLVLVHGGGPRIGEWLARMGFETRFQRGLRVTPPDQMELVEMVLTTLGKELAAGLSRRGRPTVALSGRDGLMLQARVVDEALGRVGEVERVRATLLEQMLQAGVTPLVAPIGLDEVGPLNINADTAAGAVAGALGLPAVFLTDVEGVLRDPKDPSSRLPVLSRAEVRVLMDQGVISGGMIPKVEAALNALARGAPWAAVAKGGPGVLQGLLEGTLGTRLLG